MLTFHIYLYRQSGPLGPGIVLYIAPCPADMNIHPNKYVHIMSIITVITDLILIPHDKDPLLSSHEKHFLFTQSTLQKEETNKKRNTLQKVAV